ncbi:DegV family protein [Lachnospiraceae bacterium KM106-2]|nr:DegV family protein [Lachnospiraceae bacterium KM106-2]
MNNNYVVVTDATVDLPDRIVNELDIKVIPMAFELDGKTYTHYPDERELSIESFYNKLKEGSTSTSSQIAPIIYQEFFEDILSNGQDLIYLCFTSGMSGTYQSSCMILEDLKDSYPDRKIFCVDTLSASIGEGMFVYNAALLKNEGYSIEELNDWAINHVHNARHWFTVKDLFHLKRGGRISGVEALVGTALKIRPVLSIDEEGKLTVVSKVRGSKKELEFLISKLEEEGTDLANQTVIIGHGDDLGQAQELERLIREKNLVKDIIITKIGPIIGTHTGPGMLALTFMGEKK